MADPFDFGFNPPTTQPKDKDGRPASPFKKDETVWEPESLKKARAKSTTMSDLQARAKLKRLWREDKL
jgi:hypothetical protein